MRNLTKAALIVAAAGALPACDPYYWGDDPGHYPTPPGYEPGRPPPPGYPPAYTPRPGEIVETVGCVRPGVENRCLTLEGTDGRAWNITGVQPEPDPYGEWAVRATGLVAVDAVGYCRSGMVLSEVRWEYTSVRCEPARRPAY